MQTLLNAVLPHLPKMPASYHQIYYEAIVSKMLTVLMCKAVIPSRFWKEQAWLGELLVHR